MTYFSEMDWNAKWEWENFVSFGSKATESPKKLQLADLMVIDDGEIDAGSFNLSTGGGNSGPSGSDGGLVSSSAKSSISASTDSSTKDGMQTSNFRFMSFEGFSGDFSKKTEIKGTDISGTSPPLKASIGSVEPVIGLKLGKRTYFENSGTGGNVKSASLPVIATPSTPSWKKAKSLGPNHPVPRCVVEGCNVDLSTAKDYHQKHRVCDIHSKCPKVIIGGLERRFCQQCSRFHNLSEFDENKRSCRRRLSDHNARRRKPRQDTIQFNSTRLSPPFYGGRQQMSFQLNNSPVIHSGNPATSTWDGMCNFTLTKGYPLKYNGDVGSDEQIHMQGIKQPHVTNMHGNAANGLFASKSSIPEVFNPGSQYCRALSLLSNSNSWGSCRPDSVPVHEDNGTQPMMHAVPEGVPLSSSDFWLTGHHHRNQPLPPNTNFQEIQLFKTPYEVDFYPNY